MISKIPGIPGISRESTSFPGKQKRPGIPASRERNPSLKLLKLTDLYEFHLLLYMHKSMKNNKYPVQHSLDTRSRNLAAPKFHRLSGTQRAVSFSGPTLWNKIPTELRDLSSYGNFKTKLKSYYIDKYQED